MKLSCVSIRRYLIPFTDGSLEADRPAQYERVMRHIASCDSCSAEAGRLESNDALLRGFALRSRSARERQADLSGAPTARGRVMTPLSSRVLAAIESDERFQSSNRWSPNGLSFATAALGVGVLVTIMNPQTAHMLLANLFPHPQAPAHVVKVAPAKPPYPVYPAGPAHDPMGGGATAGAGVTPVPDSNSDNFVPQDSATRNALSTLKTPSIATGSFNTPLSIHQTVSANTENIGFGAPSPNVHTAVQSGTSDTQSSGSGATETGYYETSTPKITTVPDDSAGQTSPKAFTDITTGDYSGESETLPGLNPTIGITPPTPPGPPFANQQSAAGHTAQSHNFSSLNAPNAALRGTVAH